MNNYYDNLYENETKKERLYSGKKSYSFDAKSINDNEEIEKNVTYINFKRKTS